MVEERLRVAVRCDVGRSTGVGHVMRCLALAEEFLERGHEVTFFSESAAVPWVNAELLDRGIRVLGAPASVEEFVEQLTALAADLVVFDSYTLPVSDYAAVRGAGYPLLALVDGDIAGREADLYLDQNFCAETDAWAHPLGSTRLAGIRYALMRNEILERRPPTPEHPAVEGRPVVLAFLGGTDAHGAAPSVVEALAATGRPFTATVVCATGELARRVRDVHLITGQQVEAVSPTRQLVDLAVRSDLVLSAAGTSMWEMFCLGVPTAVLQVAENQAEGYRRVVEHGLACGLGAAGDLAVDPDTATRRLATLLDSPEVRGGFGAAGWHLVDGSGRRRVVDAVVATLRAARLGRAGARR